MSGPATHLELSHIVDVDGRLIGLDAKVVTAAVLLERAGLCRESMELSLILEEKPIALSPNDRVLLSEAELLYFTSRERPRELRLAA